MDKIFSFIVNEKNNKVLLLLGSPLDPQFKRSFWYVVTGGKEPQDETLEATVKREIKEETNLDVKEIIYLNWIFKYKSLEDYCTEYVYVSFVQDTNVILNEENIDYKWCDLEEFIELIEWYNDKSLLKEVLQGAIRKEIYIKEEQTDKFY